MPAGRSSLRRGLSPRRRSRSGRSGRRPSSATTAQTENDTSKASWSSSNTAIATVETSGQTNPGLVAGVSAGSATITADIGSLDGGKSCGTNPTCMVNPNPITCSVGANVCDFDLNPEASTTATSCDGKTTNTATFRATVNPSSCQWIPSESTCSGFSSGGTVSVQQTYDNITATNPRCTVTYTASGASGQIAGQLGFTMKLTFYPSSQSVSHTVRPSVLCP
jgi:Bacterial Ig-like domain (group 2)